MTHMLCVALLLGQFQFQPQFQPKPELNQDVVNALSQKYEKVPPIRFTSEISSRRARVLLEGMHLTVLDTEFVDKDNFRIDRRDIYTDAQGRHASRMGVLWAKKGELRVWSREGDFGSGRTNVIETGLPSEAWPPFAHIPLMYFPGGQQWTPEFFLGTRQHLMLFGRFGWIGKDWQLNGLEMNNGAREFGGRSEIIVFHPNYFVRTETITKQAMNRAGTDGYSIDVSHSRVRQIKAEEAQIDFKPPGLASNPSRRSAGSL